MKRSNRAENSNTTRLQATRRNDKLTRAVLAGMLFGLAEMTGASLAFAEGGEYSEPVRDDVPRQVLWGDTHVHSSYSSDSYGLGNDTISPEQAYRFARGETLAAHNGMKVKLRHPLDFLAVTDHAEFIGVMNRIENGDPDLLAIETGSRWRSLIDAKNYENLFHEFLGVLRGTVPFTVPESVQQSIWESVSEVADRFYEPGRFTTFVAYEWTSIPMTDGGPSNLHRNVIFREGAEFTNNTVPYSAIESRDPQDLWNVLAKYEEETGGSVLAIPHNSNLSVGLMFDTKTLTGNALSEKYAKTRMRWEPIIEVTQIKGDSEAHPLLSPNDEFANFETWNSWNGPTLEGIQTEGWLSRKEAEYARSALKKGLQLESLLGANPFKFGMIGSTDSHTGFSTVAEDNFFGKFPDSEPVPRRTSNEIFDGMWPSTAISASGLAAVWARENNREEIFAAMKRKEVYATTGPRIAVRFFGGWDYPENADLRPNYVDIGYNGGVPMGGDLTGGPDGKAPRFIVVSTKDPDGANLDRAQIVKGWLDENGETHEKIYDVALSDGRVVDPLTGKAPSVGLAVDVEDASYENSIGDPVLSVTWTDPDFVAKQKAFYYVRVIEIPTPRWPAYDAKFFGTELGDDVETIIQDRAYTSPIWYTP